jgi:hypothetical protein
VMQIMFERATLRSADEGALLDAYHQAACL